jgi:hypothetical protein
MTSYRLLDADLTRRVEGTEREVPLRKRGDESGVPS